MRNLLLRTLTTLLLLGAFVTSQAAVTDVKYVLSASTYLSSPTNVEWKFQNGVTIVNSKDKTYGAGFEDGVKYSANVQFTINLPKGLSVSSITFTGYDNYGEVDAYIKELNGTAYTATDYVFPMKTGDDPDNLEYHVVKHTINFDTPVTDEITFTPAGKQVVWVITLTGQQDTSGSGTSEGTPASYTISEDTFVDSLGIGNWNFKNGVGVVNEKGKGFSKGMEKTGKYSKGVQFTITLPEKFSVNSIVFKGYGNEDANDAYLAELNGTAYGETDYVFPHRIDSKHATLVTHEVPFDTPVTGTITFTAQGAQAAWIITLKGFVEDEGGQEQGVEATYAITASNYIESPTKTEWSFKNDITVVNEGDKAYGAGKEDGVKYSANVQHTIKLPANFLVQQVTFKGYDNYDGTDAYIKELNGTTYAATDYVFPMKTGDDPDKLEYHVVKHTIDLDTPASGQLTFTPGGKQVVCAITLKGYIKEDTTFPGDVNEDNVVDVVDVMCIVNDLLNIKSPVFNFTNADMNKDNVIDVLDAMFIVDTILHKSNEANE